MGAAVEVLVIGGGIAGLCAAIAARRRGVSVRLLESAPEALRGGDARHARNFRFPHDAPTWRTPGVYAADEFLAELNPVSGVEAPWARPLIAQAALRPPFFAAPMRAGVTFAHYLRRRGLPGELCSPRWSASQLPLGGSSARFRPARRA